MVRKKNKRGLNKRIEQIERIEDEFFTIQELAKLWKVGAPAIYNWIRRGYLKAYKIGTRLRVRKEDAVAFLRERVPDFRKIREKREK